MSLGLVAGELLLLVAGNECEAQHQDETAPSQVQRLTGVTGGAASRWDTAPSPCPRSRPWAGA